LTGSRETHLVAGQERLLRASADLADEEPGNIQDEKIQGRYALEYYL
jgi:hypothetical protein